MYNLFVTAQADAWDKGFYVYAISRFLEYTSDDVAARFRDLGESQIQALKTFPCMFMYEDWISPARIGHLKEIRVRGRDVVIEFDFDPEVGPLEADMLKEIGPLLDIRSWEMSRTHWALKEVDLLECLRARGLLDATVDPPLPQEPTALPNVETAVQVSSVQAFVQEVLERSVDPSREIFYRGHSKATYRLEPSLMRTDAAGNYLYRHVEETLYRELLVSNSVDFGGDTCTIDRLVRMQHFSLPTRLLDITSNPLIALYFACKSHGERTVDGRVVSEDAAEVVMFSVQRDRIKYFDSDTVSCLANLARLSKSDRDLIDTSVGDLEAFNTQEPLKRLLHFIREEKSYFESRIKPDDLASILCIKGKRSNSRILFQSGAFLLFGHGATFNETDATIQVTRIGVTQKAGILEQLDALNINDSTVFPYIENSARYIAAKHAFRPPPVAA